MAKLWFTDYNRKYKGEEPYFFEKDKLLLAQYLEANYEKFHTELRVLWEDKKGETDELYLKEFDIFDDKQFPAASWKKLMFYVGGLKNRAAYSRFPATASIMGMFPDIMACFISRISANSEIKPHCGETNAIIRIHLGLHIPISDILLCGMQIGDQFTCWKNGQVFAFLDAHEHRVWNNYDADRYVLILDILRPEFAARKKFIVSRLLVNKLFFLSLQKLNLRNTSSVYNRFLDALGLLNCGPTSFLIWLHNKIGLVKL